MTETGRTAIAASSSRLIIDGENIPFGAYQAIYHKITKKTERFYKSYEGVFDVRFNDLSELHQRLQQALKPYSVVGNNVEISHSLSKAQSFSYSSFEKFRVADMGTTACTRSINYELNFLIILPAEIPEAEDIPQRYKVSVEIEVSDPTAPPPDLPKVFIYFSNERPVSIQIEYADYAVALAIRSIVDGWVDSLTKREARGFFYWTSRLCRTENLNLPTLFAAVPVIASLLAVAEMINPTAQELAISGLFAATLSLITVFLVDYLKARIAEASDPLRNRARIFLTTGDERIHCDQSNRRTKILKFSGFSALLIVNILVNLYSTWLYTQFVAASS